MGLKKKLLFGLAKNALKNKNAKRYIPKKRLITKILIGVAVVFTLFTIGIIALIGYGFSQVGDLVNKQPNVELVDPGQQELLKESAIYNELNLRAENWFTEYTGLSLERGQEILNEIKTWWEGTDPNK